MNPKLLEERLKNFKPEPLIDLNDNQKPNKECFMVQEDANSIDLAKTNYFNLLNDANVMKAAIDTVRIYGMGTCGPQTFYGTTDKHEEIEHYLAKFLHMEESILYSYGFMALSSTITALCKQEDLVFVDEMINTPILHGLKLSKCTIIKFNHNSSVDFALKAKTEIPKLTKGGRLFLVLESIYHNTGKLMPLLEFLPIAEQYKIRVLLDETYTVGILGETGRGILEHLNVDPSRIDVIFGTLEGALSSSGGFSAGSGQMLGQLRMCGVGWLFSASIPTYLIAVAMKAIELFENKPQRFRKLTKDIHNVLLECGFDVISDPISPFKLFNTKNNNKIIKFCQNNGVFFIEREQLLMINVNIRLEEEPERFEKLKQVLKQAANYE